MGYDSAFGTAEHSDTDEPGTLCSVTEADTKRQTLWFHFHQVPTVVTFMGREVDGGFQGWGGMRERGGVSVWGEGPGDGGDGHSTL